MKIHIATDAAELGRGAGQEAVRLIRESIHNRGEANIILATGLSQFQTLSVLIASDIDWSKVTMYHLDEYIDLPVQHAASFRKYLTDRFLSKVPRLKSVYLIDGEAEPFAECERLSAAISNDPIDVALVGIGENGHLAFNDPPADFDTTEPFIVVTLDEDCRKQQLGEGWFETLGDVPRRAISMSIQQIMLSKHIICSVPDQRKAAAVQRCFDGSISNLFPASILQQHPGCACYLDKLSSSLLKPNNQYAQ